MTKRQRRKLARILVSAALLGACMLLPLKGLWRLMAFLVPYGVVGWDVLWKAARGVAHGQMLDENFLMSLATVGAFAIGEYPEAVFVMLFYQVGELFESCAVGRSRRSIAELMKIRPDYANLEREDGAQRVDPAAVEVGQIIAIRPGERVPLDGVVLEGASSMDTSALTGESLPRPVREGDDVVSGCVNLSGLLRVRVTRPLSESTVTRILELVENCASKKARAENFITRFARVYTPCVVAAALLLAVVPGLATGDWSQWSRALIFLVVSCPCALVISVPLSFFGGIGGASRDGILVKGGGYLETLARARIVVFDKTGTLTRGVFNVTAIHPDQICEAQLLELAAYAESYSDHPISRSILQAYDREIDPARVGAVEECAGRGVRANIDARQVCVGNDRFMDEIGARWHPCHHVGTTVHVAVDGVYAGHIVISDEVKPDAAQAVREIRELGVKKIVMLTGDARPVGEQVGRELGLDQVYAQLLPADKVARVEALLGDKSPREALVFVGDGINDAPVLARADVGVAMGAMGSDAAIEAADVVFMDDRPVKLARAIRIARRTRAIVRENVILALGVKLLVMGLGAMGVATMWEAVFADVGVAVIAIVNAMRALRAPRSAP